MQSNLNVGFNNNFFKEGMNIGYLAKKDVTKKNVINNHMQEILTRNSEDYSSAPNNDDLMAILSKLDKTTSQELFKIVLSDNKASSRIATGSSQALCLNQEIEVC